MPKLLNMQLRLVYSNNGKIRLEKLKNICLSAAPVPGQSTNPGQRLTVTQKVLA